MRYFLILSLMIASTAAVAEDPGACYAISDSDARTYCLARARHDPAMCYSIFDPAKRAECRAEVHR